jgi:creatinine amidohydrolase
MESRMQHEQMDHLSWVAYEETLRDPKTIVLLPVGALEQHGPHLPLGTDALLAAAVARTVARNLTAACGTPAVVAPTINYGYKSQPKCGGGQHFTGTTSLDGGTLSGLTCDIIAELGRHGVRNVAVVSGHYENQWFLVEGIDLARRRLGPASPLRVMRLEYWDFLAEATLKEVFPAGFPGFALEHAAVIETSLMLHYFPDLVGMDKLPAEPVVDFPPYDIYPSHTHWVPSSGVLSSARGASRDKGRLMADDLCGRIVAALRTEFVDG